MTLRLVIRDANNTGLAHDVSQLSDLFELAETLELSGYASTITIPLKSSWAGYVLPVTPISGMEVVFGDDNAYPGNPDPWEYYFSGKILVPPATDAPYGLLYSLQCWDFTHETHMPIFRFERTQSDDQTFLAALITAAHLPGTWNAIDLVGGPYIAYPVGSTQRHRGKVIDIIEQIAADAGYAATAVDPRRWYVTGRWTNPANYNSGLTRYLSYFSSTDLPLDPNPLTDSPTLNVDLAADSFPAGTRLSALTLGRADTSHTWQALRGTWGVHSTSTAYLPTAHGSEVNVAIVEVAKDDAYVQAKMTVNASGAGVVGRARLPAGFVLGWLLANAGIGYALYKFQGGTTTPVWVGGPLPVNNDILKLQFSGDVVSVYINGALQITVTDPFENASTGFGLGAGVSGAPLARWDNFSVNGPHGVLYDSGWQWNPDAASMGNVKMVVGPGADPAPIEWTNVINADDDGGTLIKVEEPNAWDSGAISVEEIGEEGGEVVFQIDEYPLASDTASRPDNPTIVGELETGQDWVRAPGSTATWGVESGRIYCSALTGATPRALYANFGASTCVLEVKQIVKFTGGRPLVFRLTNEANYWYIQSNASTYTLHKRVAGVDSAAQATHSVTPANNDVLKVSLEGTTIRFYLNGAGPFMNVTDAFNENEPNHGIGVVTGGTAARWDDFLLKTAYHDKFIGLDRVDTNQNYTDGEFGMYFKANRTLDITQSGSTLISGTTYAVGDEFRISMALVPATPPRFDVTYWKRAASATAWVLLYTSLVHPDPQVTPYHVDTALFHTGAAWSTVTLEHFSGAIYRDEASIDTYGVWPAQDVTEDAGLDTLLKRRNQAHSWFRQNGTPLNTYEVPTLHRYRGGYRVLYNNSRLNITNSLRTIARVTADRSMRSRTDTMYSVALDNPPKIYGQRRRSGHLAGGPDNPTLPPKPTNFRSTDCSTSGVPRPNVLVEFAWDVPSETVQFIEIVLGGMTAQPPVRFAASAGHGSIILRASTTYLVRARFRPYRGDPGPFSDSFALVTCAHSRPGSATGLTVTRVGIVGNSGAALLSWTPPTPAPYRYRLCYYTQDGGPVGAGQTTVLLNGSITSWVIEQGLQPGKTYVFELWSQDEDGTESLKPATATQAFAAKIFRSLPNGDFSEIDQLATLPNRPRWWTVTDAGSTVSEVSTTKAVMGGSALKVPLTGAADGTTLLSQRVAIVNASTTEIQGKYGVRFRLVFYADNSSGYITGTILWKNLDGSPASTPQTIPVGFQAVQAGKNVLKEDNYLPPVGAVFADMLVVIQGVGSINNNVWVTGCVLEDAVAGGGIKKGGVGSSELGGQNQLQNPQFAMVTNDADVGDLPPQPMSWGRSLTLGAVGEAITGATLYGDTALELQLPGVVGAEVSYTSEWVPMQDALLEPLQAFIKIAQEADNAHGLLEVFIDYDVIAGPSIPSIIYNDVPLVAKDIIKAKVDISAWAIARRVRIVATDDGTANNIRLVIVSEGIAANEDALSDSLIEAILSKIVTTDDDVVVAGGEVVWAF